MALLLPYTEHDLNVREEEGQLTIIVRGVSLLCTKVWHIAHTLPAVHTDPHKSSILNSLHKIAQIFRRRSDRKLPQHNSVGSPNWSRVGTFASNGLLINYLNPNLPGQLKTYKAFSIGAYELEWQMF